MGRCKSRLSLITTGISWVGGRKIDASKKSLLEVNAYTVNVQQLKGNFNCSAKHFFKAYKIFSLLEKTLEKFRRKILNFLAEISFTEILRIID